MSPTSSARPEPSLEALTRLERRPVVDRAALYIRPVRAMFVIYLVGIAAGLSFYIVIGLTHH